MAPNAPAFGRFYGDSFNKKRKKNTSNPKQPSVPAYAGTGGCSKNNSLTYTVITKSAENIGLPDQR